MVKSVRRRSYAMNELFPIIRRKRRPLVVSAAPPVVVGSVEPLQVVARPAEPVVTGEDPKANDAKAAENQSER
jgi:hypothetical protein